MSNYGAEDAVCTAADVTKGYVCYVEFGLFAALSAFRRVQTRNGERREGEEEGERDERSLQDA